LLHALAPQRLTRRRPCAVASEDAVGQLRRFVDGWARVAAAEADAGTSLGLGPGSAANALWCPDAAPSRCVTALRRPAPPCAHARARVGSLEEGPGAHVSLHALAATDNPAFSKCITVFAALLVEARRVHSAVHARHLPALLAFGEPQQGNEPPSDAALTAALAAALPGLQAALAGGEQAHACALNVLHQLSALCADAARAHAPLQTVHLRSAFAAAGDCLAALAALDAAAAAAPALGAALDAARRALATRAAAAPLPEPLAALDGALRSMSARLCPPRFLEAALGEAVATPAAGPYTRPFLEQLATAAGARLADALGRVAARAERPADRADVAAALCLAVTHARLAAPYDAPLMAAAVATGAALPTLPLGVHLAMRPDELLAAHLPSALRSGLPGCEEEAAAGRARAVAALDTWLARETAVLGAHGAAWLSRADADGAAAAAAAGAPGAVVAGGALRGAVQGLLLAARARGALLSALQAHDGAGAPLTSARLRQLAALAELLVGVRTAHGRRAASLARALPHAARLARARLAAALAPVREALAAGAPAWAGRGDGARLDALAALQLAQRCLEGPLAADARRAALLALALDVLTDPRVLPPAAAADVRELAALAELAGSASDTAARLCDCSFLHFWRELLPAVLAECVERPADAPRIPAALRAFCDADALLRRGGAPATARAALAAELAAALDGAVTRPLAAAVEAELRLHLHAARLAGAVDVAPGAAGVRDLAPLLQLPSLRLPGGRAVRLRRAVSAALAAAFHAHTGLALHDGASYGDMARLAADKYSLRVAPPALPGHTLEQGLDVLEVVRNMHLFAARFAYALHASAFVERPAGAAARKHLHVLAARHVANSMRTHGAGVANTTVNCVYRFLAAKLRVVSQFMYDDAIRSRLAREGRHVAEAARAWRTRGGAPPEYPAERAARLAADIRRLGSAPDGASFLDQYRGTVAELGNALGFVRLVRLGALRHANDAAACLPRRAPPPRMAAAARAASLAPPVAAAAEALDAALTALLPPSSAADGGAAASTAGADYFAVLVAVFSPELRSEGNAHLRDFWLLLPALCLSHCEALAAAKERLGTRGRDAATAGFTDDGFALGVAYLLRVLGQERDFDTLRWHDSVCRFYAPGQAAAAQPATAARRSGSGATAQEDAAASADMRQTKAATMLGEAKLLHYTLTGARTFFASESAAT
jgi:WASH complex subunit 7